MDRLRSWEPVNLNALSSMKKLLILFLIFPLLDVHSATLPSDSQVSGEMTGADGWLLASEGSGYTTVIKGMMSEEAPVFVLRGKIGKDGGGLKVVLRNEAGRSISFAGSSMPLVLRAKDQEWAGTVYPDYCISMGWASYFVRPDPRFYAPKIAIERRPIWEQVPGASEHIFTLELRPGGKEDLEIWLDGQFIQSTPWKETAASFEVGLSQGGGVESVIMKPLPSASRVTLPVASFPRGDAMSGAYLEFDANARLPEAFQKLGGKATEGIAVGGLGTYKGLLSDDLQSFFWRRHASHQLPEQRMFSVPLATYAYANILCAVDGDAEKVNRFTFRVTRYGSSRGNAMADTIVEVPANDAAGRPNAQRVGSVSYGAPGSRGKASLWLIRVPIKNGLIQDLIYDDTGKAAHFFVTHRYLDVELLDPLARVDEADAFPPPQYAVQRAWTPTAADYQGADYYGFWPQAETSGVSIFGIELERSPAAMTVRGNPGFQTFYASDNPELIATVLAEEAGNYTVQWDIADVDGKIVDTGTQIAKLDAGAEQKVVVPVKTGVGWYATRVRLLDEAKTELLDTRTSFVMLPPDTRKAGFESPFYGAWFGKNQGSDVKLDEGGPLLQRLGIHRAGLEDSMPEVESKRYGLTESTIGWGIPNGGKHCLQLFGSGKNTVEEVMPILEATVRAKLEKWPSIDRMDVFHESGSNGAPFPSEMWGVPAPRVGEFADENSPEALLKKQAGDHPSSVPWNEADRAAWGRSWPKRMEFLTAMAKMMREKFPQVKLQYGNDGNSLGIVGEIFRQKFPREYINAIAIEDLGQTIAPERFSTGGLHSAWFLRETARKMGYGDVPVTACTEWIGRMSDRLGLKAQAEWKARDGILALAYGFDTINIGGLTDASSGYYYSIWGNGGVCSRYPTMAPKPAYAAVATLTQVLDQAKFLRFVPTGSTVLQAGEFQRGDQWIYAIWTPRGERKVTVEFPAQENQARPLIDLYGRESSVSGQSVQIKAGTGVQYLVSKEKALSITAGAASYPEDKMPAAPETVIPLESLSDISIVSDKSKENRRSLVHLYEGDFTLTEVDDPEMGKCLELELKSNRQMVWDNEHDYVYLKLPHPLRTTAKNAGILIKGNGSWGRVDIWKTRAWGPWADNGNLQISWPGKATLNFDGWNFITYPYYDWAKEKQEGLGTRNEVLGIYLSMPKKAMDGTELVPVPNLKIRIKSIVLF